MERIQTIDYASPLGVLEISGTEDGVCSILFTDRDEPILLEHEDNCHEPLLVCWQQLDEYFSGKRQSFSVSLWMKGTDFQKSVWHTLTTIPYAHKITYTELAALIGKENAVRAVGNANGKNRLNIIVPCHRIIGANGSLTGYSGGLWRKEWLLTHEQCSLNKEE
ncbi:methylated-DNA--[protein]-cysteine S-methyltransferase [Brevibacillus sp. HB1.2]|uniref:methylated-DNA--[protein]-cysteine S-methyltransferase n=1 Tax=Brevibacillus sp. HB1.2 TaxID=2738807 RepID=UPI001576A9E2|nr:methylated-DNA--[protein]-cysteine S-methyltransferase [Brevibacillus sp. HB1.2]NTU19948.1 methylated-DNA--[protein]-cysteine S-methyltransferase [Brevibacillus sp. HB1.2]